MGQDEDAWLWLSAVEGCHPSCIAALLDPEVSPRSVLSLQSVFSGLPRAAERRRTDPDTHRVARDWRRRARESGLRILYPGSKNWPRRLATAPLRPAAMFARGALDVLTADAPHVAVVGSRTPTAYGKLAAEDFARRLADAGAILWSGLAQGVDGLAHRAALAAGAPTVAVLAGGLDRIFPSAHERLARDILDRGGALLSELPIGMRPHRGHFPRRNRILAGATLATLVIEAGRCSGSLHTARFAGDECGAAVFAVPGPYTSSRSIGCHDLIAEGAGIATSPGGLLSELGIAATLRGEAPRASLEVSAQEAAILAVLESGPRPADLVQREARMDRGAFLTAVANLVAKGAVLELPGDLLGIPAGESPQ